MQGHIHCFGGKDIEWIYGVYAALIHVICEACAVKVASQVGNYTTRDIRERCLYIILKRGRIGQTP